MVATVTAESGTKFQYRIEDGHACIVKCTAQANDIRIPEMLGGFEVSALADGSFSKLTRAKRIECPKGLRHIGKRAFEGCMHLCDVKFNEGLKSIGEEAFFLCSSLKALDLPASVESVGVNLTGGRGNKWARNVNVRVSPACNHVVIDSDNVIYQRTPHGLVLVDGTKFEGERFVCDPRTVAVGPRAFAQHDDVRSVILPEGLEVIGEEAFRGCTKLARVSLPTTLRAIRDAAFSCTALESISLPAACTELDEFALVTGPVVKGMPVRAYRSQLASLSVAASNPRYAMCGKVLCERDAASGELKALIAPCSTGALHLEDVTSFAANVFAGTTGIASLHLADGVRFEGEFGLLPHAACSALGFSFETPVAGLSSIEAVLPSGSLGTQVIAKSFSDGAASARSFLACYDEALLKVADKLEQARLMIARLAAPAYLSQDSREEFRAVVEEGFESICAHFGVRNYWIGFDQLMDAGILDEARLADVMALLSRIGDTPTVGYLLDCKRRRFGKAHWDYDL